MGIERHDRQRLIAVGFCGCRNSRPNESVGIVLDVFEPHFAELIGEQLAQHALARRAGIGGRAFDGRRVDLHVAEEAAEEAGVVDE